MDAEILLSRLSEKYASPLPPLDALERRYGAVRPNLADKGAVYPPDRRKAESLFSRLSEKYGSPLSALERRYGAIRPDVTSAPENWTDERAPEDALVFTDNPRENEETLTRIMRGYERMVEGILSVAGGHREPYETLLRNYADKVRKLSRHCKDGEKMAGEFPKILRQTLLKLWLLNERDSPVKACLREYFRDCGIRSQEYRAGRRLSDDDLTYLDTQTTQAFIKTTRQKEKNYEVIQMIRPILFIGYQEEDEDMQDACVEGICSYYVCER